MLARFKTLNVARIAPSDTQAKIWLWGNFSMKQIPRNTDLDPLGRTDLPLCSKWPLRKVARLYVFKADTFKKGHQNAYRARFYFPHFNKFYPIERVLDYCDTVNDQISRSAAPCLCISDWSGRTRRSSSMSSRAALLGRSSCALVRTSTWTLIKSCWWRMTRWVNDTSDHQISCCIFFFFTSNLSLTNKPLIYLIHFASSLSQKRELVDLATVSDQEIKNDEVVFMIFSEDNGQIAVEELTQMAAT